MEHFGKHFHHRFVNRVRRGTTERVWRGVTSAEPAAALAAVVLCSHHCHCPTRPLCGFSTRLVCVVKWSEMRVHGRVSAREDGMGMVDNKRTDRQPMLKRANMDTEMVRMKSTVGMVRQELARNAVLRGSKARERRVHRAEPQVNGGEG